jgi:exonuclease SbcC
MKRIKIKNFQSHRNTDIVLDECITAIVGKSNHGKSSVRRAIEWVVTNKPQGTAFIKKKAKEASVSIDKVEHVRTKSINAYRYNENEYKALRGKVPEEVQEALNLGEINIQDQHSSIFLLQDTPGKVAQKLSELSNIEEALRTLKHVNTSKGRVSASVKFLKKEYDDSKKELYRLRFVVDVDKELSAIEQIAAKIEKIQQDRATLYKAIENAKQATKRLNTIPSTDALQPAKQVVQVASKACALEEETAQLKQSIHTIQVNKAIAKCNPIYLLDKIDKIILLLNKKDKVDSTLKELKKMKKEAHVLKKRQADLEHKKAKLLKDKCPLCGK